MTYPPQTRTHAPSHLFLSLVILAAICALATPCSPEATPQAGQPSRAIGAAQAEATPVIPGMPSCYCPMPTAETTSVTPAGTPTPSPTIAIATKGEGKIVAVDPGHGGIDSGAVGPTGLEEKNVNLKIALKLAALLTAGGYTPALTRDSDSQVNTSGRDLNGNGVVDSDDDLQARVDIANEAHADILVSIHNDGSTVPSTRGTRVYYSLDRPFTDKSIKLASALQTGIVASLHAAGYNPLDDGIGDDGPLKKPYGHLFLLGPLSPRVARASNMPGALGESLFISNPTEGALLARDDILAAIAKGYYDGIVRYFSQPQ